MERPSHDRTTVRHWQSPIFPPGGLLGNTAAAHATSPRPVALRLPSVPSHGGVRPGWDGRLSLGPLPPRTLCRRHRRRSNGVGVQDDRGWSDPGTPLFRGATRCWPSAGLLVGGQLACRQVTPGKLGCGLPLRGHRVPGPVRASVLLSRVLTEAGVTPAVHLRGPAPLAASPTPPVSESDKCCRTRGAHLGVRSRHPRP